MTCNGFKKFCLGEWTQDEFQEHLRTCPECRVAYEQDRILMDMSHSLKSEVEAPGLWSRLENDLRNQQGLQASFLTGRLLRFKLYRIAAVLIFGLFIGLGLVFSLKNEQHDPSSGLLAETVLKNVENRQKAYESAITKLEAGASSRLVALDQELMLLYRDRLEVIDEQIEQCREALATNPANAHIHRYLLAALQDKKETLTEIMNIKTIHQQNQVGRSS